MVRIKISLGIIIAMLVMSVSGIFILNYKTNGRNITLMQVFLSETIKLQVFRLLCPDLNR